MPDRMQFSAGELRLLCDCVATICYNIAGGHGYQRFLPAADAVLADFGGAAHSTLTKTDPDLTQLVLAEFSSSTLRHNVLARVISSLDKNGLARPSYPTVASTSPALELVDRRFPEQAFPFRAALILIAMAIEDEVARDGC